MGSRNGMLLFIGIEFQFGKIKEIGQEGEYV